jgi:hypothetical protein
MGNVAHATPAQRAADYERANSLPRWRFVWLTYNDVLERPGYAAAAVAAQLASTS